jgi:hypothetical protein
VPRRPKPVAEQVAEDDQQRADRAERAAADAVEWDVLDRMPCTIRHLPTPKSSAHFHDFGAYERLVQGAEWLDRRTYLLVLLGDAGLPCGEMMALEWRKASTSSGPIGRGR